MKTNVSVLRRIKNQIKYFRFMHCYNAMQRMAIEDGIDRGLDVSRYMYPWLPQKEMDIIRSKLLDEIYNKKELVILLFKQHDDCTFIYSDKEFDTRRRFMGDTSFPLEYYRSIMDHHTFEVDDKEDKCTIYIRIKEENRE